MRITLKNSRCKVCHSYIRTISQLIVQYSPIMKIMANRSKSSYNMQIFFSKTMDETDNAQKNKTQKNSKSNTGLRIYIPWKPWLCQDEEHQ